MVDDRPAPAQLGRHPPVAIAWELERDPLDAVAQFPLVDRLVLIVVGAGRDLKQPAEPSHRALRVVLAQHVDHRPPLREAEPLAQPLFRIVSSNACWPTSRSSSAIRAASPLASARPSWKICAPRSWKRSRQRESRSWPMLCSRAICAALFWPLSNSSTTWSFNCGL